MLAAELLRPAPPRTSLPQAWVWRSWPGEACWFWRRGAWCRCSRV